MRRQRGLVGLMGLAALVGLGLLQAKTAAAGITTEQRASILVFPKVIANGTRDTIIQITNVTNSLRFAHCFYINGALTYPALPPGNLNPPLCTETDFDIVLTRQQPTHWVVSTGRLVNSEDTCHTATCVSTTSGTAAAACCDAGFDPDRVPPVVGDFVGELKCIEVDQTGAPEGGNALQGEATLVEVTNHNDVEKYNAIGIQGFDTNDQNTTLCLGGVASDTCPLGPEYAACPAGWLLDHPLTAAIDPVIEQQAFCTAPPCSKIATTLTVVPCTEMLETQAPVAITLQFSVTNEFEQTLTASTAFSCFASFNLGTPLAPPYPADDRPVSSIFNAGTIGGTVALTRMRAATVPQASVPSVPIGVLAVIEESHADLVNRYVAGAAQNGHTTFDDQTNGDLIIYPPDQGQQD